MNTAFIHHYRLKNGLGITLRLATMEDAPLIWQMHQQLSSMTIYKRYLRHYQPTLEAIQNLCQVNSSTGQGAVLIATCDQPHETVIGIAYYIVEENPSAAEPALLVKDEFQGQGVGRYLGEHLYEYAISQGVETFYAYALAGNEAVSRLIGRSGLVFSAAFSQGVREFQIELVEKSVADHTVFESQWQDLFIQRDRVEFE